MTVTLIYMGAFVAVSIIAAYGFIEYAKIKYGSQIEIAQIREDLDNVTKIVVQYKKDDIHRRVSALEAKVGTGFTL